VKRKPRTIEEVADTQHHRWRRFAAIRWSIHGTHAVLHYGAVTMPPLCIVNSKCDGRDVAALWIREAREVAKSN
jgi:hypothetical protein